MTGVTRDDGTEGGEEGNREKGEERGRRKRRGRRRKIVANGTGRDDIEGSRRGPRRPKKTSISKAIKSIAILCSRFLRSKMLKEYQQ